jgi:hypothetical protein
MKKLLLLSVTASAVLMAGGNVVQVETTPTVPTAETVETLGWDFSGQSVIFYQSGDRGAEKDLFGQKGSLADFGLQLKAVNKDIFAGIGAGVEVSGLSSLNLENWMVSNTMQGAGEMGDVDSATDGAWISQMYLTYGLGNTTLKLGRQELPKALSPFAFSEGWNVFKNTFDAAVVINKDFADTTLVGAWVSGGNHNGMPAIRKDASNNPYTFNNMSDFNSLNNSNGIYMLSAQNKSIDGLTLTGTYYYAPTLVGNNDAHILWGDAKFKVGDYNVAAQLGTIMSGGFTNNTFAWGVKVGADFDIFDASIAYSSVDNGDRGVNNFGGVKTPLYTQMILNQDAIKTNNMTFVARVGTKALGGRFDLAYGYSGIMDDSDRGCLVDGRVHGAGAYSELDLTYKTKILNDDTTLFAGYIFQSRSYAEKKQSGWSDNILRFWVRYNF